MEIAVIGAGIGGLASAIRLAAAGHQVDVFESNAYPGGKLSTIQVDGYRFDAGPSLFTMPEYVEALFQLAGKDIRQYFEYEKLDVVCHYFWEDGTQLKAHADETRFAQEVEQQLGVDGQVIHRALADSQKKYELTGQTFLHHTLHSSKTWMTKSVAQALLQLPSLDIFRSMDQVNTRNVKHPKLVQLFNRFATYNGSNPYKAPGILNIIPYFEHKIGAFFPKGGMYSITKALYQLAQDLGARFYFEQSVSAIQVQNQQAQGIVVDGQSRSYQRIVSNMDIYYTYKKLLPQEKHPERILRQEKSTSALIFYWGIKKAFPQLALHNILFSDDYRAEFEHLDRGQIFSDPTIYINISQKHAPEDAPQGCENWFTMINVPNNTGQDWEELIQTARRQMITKINRMLTIDLESLIACEHLLDPRSIESKTTSHRGALYGTSSNNRMAAFLRHPNFSRRIKNLYFCGGSVHPGGGIPLCLLSAQIVAQCLQNQK
ncbi:MAG: 1-hydroxycarotenoid 3,4-desaturase CrtD [Bacteroidota bacterium]